MIVYDIDRLRAAVSQRLPEKRLSHVLSVEEQCARLARLVLPHEMLRLRAAALLHDITKNIPDAEQAALCDRLGISLTSAERAAPPILHARSGAEVAARDFPEYADEGIRRAIALHTTGAVGMNLFERVLMVADFSEPHREWERCRMIGREIAAIPASAPLSLRRALFDRAFLHMLMVKYEYIGTTGTVWHDGTDDMLLYYKARFSPDKSL